jgi:hypothetical protein
MSGRDLAEALLSASRIEIDDAADVLAWSVRGREIVEQFTKRVRVYHDGPPQLTPFYKHSAPTKRRRAK